MARAAKKERKSDVAYDRLRRAIIRAEIAPGEALEEAVLMKRLKLGRTPLREALLRLAHEDLVTVVPQRGYFVSSISATEFFHLSEFRLASEMLACRLAAVRITDAEIDELAGLIEEARQGVREGRSDHEWHLDIDERIHQVIARAAANPYLARTLVRLYALSLRSLYVSRIPITLVSEELDNYALLFDALKARDPERAAAAMSRHLDWSVLQVLRPPATPRPAAMAAKAR